MNEKAAVSEPRDSALDSVDFSLLSLIWLLGFLQFLTVLRFEYLDYTSKRAKFRILGHYFLNYLVIVCFSFGAAVSCVRSLVFTLFHELLRLCSSDFLFFHFGWCIFICPKYYHFFGSFFLCSTKGVLGVLVPGLYSVMQDCYCWIIPFLVWLFFIWKKKELYSSLSPINLPWVFLALLVLFHIDLFYSCHTYMCVCICIYCVTLYIRNMFRKMYSHPSPVFENSDLSFILLNIMMIQISFYILSFLSTLDYSFPFIYLSVFPFLPPVRHLLPTLSLILPCCMCLWSNTLN